MTPEEKERETKYESIEDAFWRTARKHRVVIPFVGFLALILFGVAYLIIENANFLPMELGFLGGIYFAWFVHEWWHQAEMKRELKEISMKEQLSAKATTE